MANLLIGDIHGCYDELRDLLIKADFHPTSDKLWLTGDLIARGQDSLKVLRYVKSLGSTVRLVLGNHELNLFAIYAKIRQPKPKDHLSELLNAPDCGDLILWLKRQPLLQEDHQLKLVMAHAGITPQWTLQIAKKCAEDVSKILSSTNDILFLYEMYGDYPNHWTPQLTGINRLRFSTNALTRMRYCYPNGQLDLNCKSPPNLAPAPLKPWFLLPNPLLQEGYAIAFGHWAALEGKETPPNVYALDTGCCWGNKLTLLRFEDKTFITQQSHQ